MRRAIPRGENVHFATVSCKIDPPNPTRGLSSKSKMCVSLQRRAIQNFKMYVSLQRRAQQCMNPARDVRGNQRHTKITILPQFRTSDQHEVTRCLRRPTQNLHFITVLDVRWARNDEKVARRHRGIAFHHSFGRATSTKWPERLRPRSRKFAFHHSFGRPTSRKWREGCEGHVQNSHFTTVLDVQEIFKEVLIHSHSQQLFSAQPFSAQRFSADLLSTAILSSHSQHSHSQQIFSAQPFSAAILSRSSQHSHSQQPFSAIMLLWSRVGGQLYSHQVAVVRGWWSAIVPSCCCCGQGLVVKGWWSTILIMLLWSGVGGQLYSHQIAVVRGWWSAIVSSCCCGQGLVVNYPHHVAVVRGWWWAIFSSDWCGQGLVVSYCLIMLLWSGVGGQLLSHHVAMVKGWWSTILTSCCCGQGLVVHVGGQLRTRSLEEPFRGAFGKIITQKRCK